MKEKFPKGERIIMLEDPGTGNWILAIVLIVLLIVVEMFIYLCRAALMALTDTRAQEMTESEKSSVRRLISHKDHVFLSMSYGSIFVTLVVATISELEFGTRLAAVFARSGMGATLAIWLSGFIICITAALVMMSVAGIIPRRIGRMKPSGVLKRFSGFALILYYLNIPFVKIAEGISLFIMKLTGIDRLKEEEQATEAEILSMVDAGEESGTIENDQSEYIKNIFEFDDVYVSDLMTHRTDVTAIDASASIDQFRILAQEEGYSRIPVYEEDIDNVIGVAYSKDMLQFVGEDVPMRLKVRDIMHEPFYVPETMPCDKLFKDMNQKRVQIAIAVDEYGGTAGIITLEDIMESIFGSIRDEYDEEETDEVSEVTDNVYLIEGTTDIEDVEESLGITIPRDDDYDTVGGFLIAILGFIPEDGTEAEIDYEGFHWTAMDVDDRRIGKIRAEKQAESPSDVEKEENAEERSPSVKKS